MIHLIDKDAVFAEIDKRISLYQDKDNFDSYTRNALMCLKKDIDTLEVKEVNLEKNSLTWKDISATRRIMAECRRQMSNEMQILNDEELCKEVLKRFKAQKGEEV